MTDTRKDDTDLEISRYLAAPRAKLWDAWADPKKLAQWWCPKPWVTEVRAFDFRPGGDFYTFMRGPDENGNEATSDNPGCFLEVVPMERIVTTSMLKGGWRPASPWLGMTSIITMADEGAGTRYVARVLHGSAEDSKKHEDMGFFDGWNTCITQLEEFAQLS
ncbi:MAG: SRPBCC family protein [Caulobacterales bacterium]